jgi:FtsP/CotA-like multicopper oxidase with cupredoxin domain
MPIYILDFVLHGQGDIAIEADDPMDAERKFSAIPVEGLMMARRMEVRGISLLPEHLVPVFRRLADDYAARHGKADEASTAPPQAEPGAGRGVLGDKDGKPLEPVVSTDHEIKKDAMSEHYCQFIPSPDSKDGFCLAFVDRDTPGYPGYYEDDDGREVLMPVIYFNPGCGKPASLEWKSGDRTWWLCEEHYDLASKVRGSAGSAGGTEGFQEPA